MRELEILFSAFFIWIKLGDSVAGSEKVLSICIVLANSSRFSSCGLAGYTRTFFKAISFEMAFPPLVERYFGDFPTALLLLGCYY